MTLVAHAYYSVEIFKNDFTCMSDYCIDTGLELGLHYLGDHGLAGVNLRLKETSQKKSTGV